MSETNTLENKKIHLKITTHEKVVYEADVDSIYTKSTEGEFGILPNHMPFTCVLDIGVTKVDIVNRCELFTTMGGVFQFKDNEALILTPVAEKGSDIDVMRAEESKKRAEARLAQSVEDSDVQRAEIALARALTRLKAARG